MKKIGILFGRERTFPMAFIERVNSRNTPDVIAEPVHIDKVIQGAAIEYDVILDRISHDVPFYRSYLKNAALGGTAVINNPFWESADEKFFNNSLAVKIGVPVPKTVILPSYELPPETSSDSFANLAWPLDWEKIFEYVGFPAYMKPFAGGGWKNVFKLYNKEDFFHTHKETGHLVMLLQEEILFEEYYRCYCIGGKYVHIMPYDPRNPHHLRYTDKYSPSPDLVHQMEEIVCRLNQYLGYDFTSVELAIRDGVPYAIDFCNPAPDADRPGVGDDNFEWVVDTITTYAIERALTHKAGQNNLTWGEFTRRSLNREPLGKMKK